MSEGSVRLRAADRTALTVLCLLLIAAIWVRLHANGAPIAVANPVELGQGVSLAQGEAVRRLVRMASCSDPITTDFVEPLPHGGDTSLASSLDPNDYVFYVYRERILDGPYAATKLGLLHLLWRVGAVVRLNGTVARDELAVKIIMPAACHVPPTDVVAALRRDVRPDTSPAGALQVD